VRTWHKSYWNWSDGDRCAILNNVLPNWVMPMMDQSDEYSQVRARPTVYLVFLQTSRRVSER
jgi:hypothetical protein